jgi:beta-lactam-binding protein with PASTA domain
MQKNWWFWLGLPAAATTALLVSVAAFSGAGEEASGPTIAPTANPKPAESPPPTGSPTRQTTTRARTPTTTRTATNEQPATLARVPDLYGLTPAQALVELEQAGFRVRIRRERSFQPDGLVFEQSPSVGRRFRQGKTVVLTVSVVGSRAPAPRQPPAPPVSAVPRLVGLDYWEAAARMQILGIVANSYPVRSGRRFGTVVGQAPVAGIRVPRGSRVRLFVSVGNEALQGVEVPDTVGLSEPKAHARCRDADFTCRTVLVATSEPGDVGRVVRQTPPAGQVHPRLTQMTLSVGS